MLMPGFTGTRRLVLKFGIVTALLVIALAIAFPGKPLLGQSARAVAFMSALFIYVHSKERKTSQQ